MKKILLFIFLLLVCTNSFAKYESGSNDAASTVLYGKTSGGVLVPIKVDGTGKISTSGAGGAGAVTNLSCSDDIQTKVNAATAGDTLILGSCTYTITATITSSIALTITGQGPNSTIIASSTNSLAGFFAPTADSFTLSNLTLSGTGNSMVGFQPDCTGGAVCNNINLNHVTVTLTGAGTEKFFLYKDAGGTIQDSNFIGTSSNGAITGGTILNASTAEAATIINMYRNYVSDSSGGTTAYALLAQSSSSPSAETINFYDGWISSTTSSGTAGVMRAIGSNAVVNIYHSYALGGSGLQTSSSSGTTNAWDIFDGFANAIEPLGFRQGVAATAGTDVTFSALGATIGATDAAGGNAIISGGQCTGNAGSDVILSACKTAGSTGSSDNLIPARVIVHQGQTITNNSQFDLFDLTGFASINSDGGTIIWEVTNTDNTDVQVLSGITNYAISYQSGTFVSNIIENISNEAKVATAGTISTTWAVVTSGATASIEVTLNSSLTSATGHPRINYTILHNGYQTVTTH